MQSSAAENLPEIEELALRVLSPSKQIYRNWSCLYDPDKPWRGVNLDNINDRTIIPSPLYYASGAGLEGIVGRLLRAGSDPNFKGGMFGSALQAASYYGHAAIVKNLLSSGANVNICSGVFKNPLATAVVRGHQKIVQILLEWGAKPDTVSFESGTSLVIACRSGSSGLVRVLLESGANPNKYSLKGGGAPLGVATELNHVEIVSQLLPKTAQTTILRSLDYLGEHNSREIVKLYYKYVPHSALDRAVELGWKDTVMELLNQGGFNSSITAQDDESELKASVLVSAAARGCESLVRQMIESGIDVNEKSEVNNSWSDYAIGCAAEQGHIAIVKLLLENKAYVNTVSARGDALQRAARSGHQTIVEILLQAGAKIDQADGPYAGALQAAVNGRQMSVAKFLLEKGANVNVQRMTEDYGRHADNYGTALQTAVGQGDIEMTQYLLSKGADVNATSKEFGSPLSTAASLGNEILLKLLLEAGANADLDGRQGTPLFHAIRSKRICGMDILIKSGASVNIVCCQESCKLTPLTEAILNDYEEGVKVVRILTPSVNSTKAGSRLYTQLPKEAR
jgi:ankyrin repeat protein